MGCHGNHAFQHMQNKVFSWGQFFGGMESCNIEYGIFSWGSKVGQIRSQGTCNIITNMILFSVFSSFFVFISSPNNTFSPWIFEDFS